MKRTLLLGLILLISSCAHQSGRYILKSGKWVFVRSTTGFLNQNSAEEEYTSNNGDFIWPVPSSFKVSSKYGPRRGSHHDGIDIAARKGAHIMASANGKVIYSGRMRGYGKVVVIKHSGKMHTVYAHNSRNMVKRGERVSQGQVIGKVGNTGRSSGPHLHFEIRNGDKVLNPAHYLTRVKKSLLANK